MERTPPERTPRRLPSDPPPVAPDDELRIAIESQLRWDARVNPDGLTVGVIDGVATLTGSTPSYFARRAAEQTAAAVPGVRAVVNRLRVEHPEHDEPPSDEEILRSAEQVLRWSPALDFGEIEVAVSGGDVLLTGFVDQLWKRAHAEELVASLNGITGVDNRLRVRPPLRPTDRQILEDVRAALDRSIVADADDVRVRVDEGTVTLTGAVPNARSREEASHAAFFTRGVVSVRNEITVDPRLAVGKLRTGVKRSSSR